MSGPLGGIFFDSHCSIYEDWEHWIAEIAGLGVGTGFPLTLTMVVHACL